MKEFLQILKERQAEVIAISDEASIWHSRIPLKLPVSFRNGFPAACIIRGNFSPCIWRGSEISIPTIRELA
jgi:hypothetical protein